MKVLTIVATIFIPLTFLVGSFGMHFVHRSELCFRWEYPVFRMLILAVAGGMVAFFSRMPWVRIGKAESLDLRWTEK